MRFLLSIGYIMMMSSQVFAGPNVQKVLSPKHKIEAWLVESHHVPLVSLQFSFLGGSAHDTDAKAGLTQFICGLMDEGSGEDDAEAFHKKIESLALRMSFFADADRLYGGFQYLSKNKDPSLALMKQVIESPRFDPEPMERIRQQVVVGIERKRESPGLLANEKAFASMYPNHPYGRPSTGTIESVQSFNVSDLKNLMAERFTKENLLIGVAGDIQADELGKILDDLFGALPDKSKLSQIVPIKPQLDGQLHVVQLQDRPQTVSFFIQEGIDREDPDFYAAYVLNHILGGGTFTARLMTEVRSKRGLTYGVSTQLSWMDKSNYLIGSCSTENGRFHESFDVIKSVYKELSAKGPTQEELDEAKSYIMGAFPLMLDSTKSIANFLVRMQKDKLGIDFLEKRNKHIEQVNADQIQKLALRFLNADKLTFFAAGNPQESKSTKPNADENKAVMNG